MFSMRLMRFSLKIQAKNNFFISVLNSPTQIGFDVVTYLESIISCLGPFHSDFENCITVYFTCQTRAWKKK